MARPLRIARVNRVDRVVHRLRPGRAAVSVVAVTLLLATSACSSDDTGANDDGPAATGDTGSTDDTTVSPAVVDQLAEWSDRGPHGVGSVQLDLAGRRTVVWYPAEEGAGTEEPLETFDITGLLSPELQAEVPADMRVQHPIAARPGAEPATGGPFPVVLFSHGFAGFPEQSASLTTHLASWGYVVAATDHVERSLSGLLGTGAQGVEAAEDDEVLSDLLDLVALQADDPTSPLAGLVDLEHVAATGHSAGAAASYTVAATDDRIDAFVAYSLRGPEEVDVPTVPGLVMLGELDATIEPDITQAAYDAMATPRYLLSVADAGHLVFSDVCLIGRDQGGLVGIVESIGLDIPADLLSLASDGCQDDLPPVDDAFGAIDAVSVAFLRAYLDGDDAAAASLVPEAVSAQDGWPATLTADP